MKILSLKSENVKRLSVVEVIPKDKGLVIIAGKNGAGKSAVLDSIMYALAGEDSIPTRPVRRGEDKAKVELDLGDYSVTRTMTAAGGGQLVVRNKDGARQASPQAILDGLYGRLSFDPLQFQKQKPADRSETLRQLLGLDFEKEDKEIDRLAEDRRLVNRDAKALEARLAATTEYPDAPAEELSASAIIDEQRKASAVNAENSQTRNTYAILQQQHIDGLVRLKQQESHLQKLREDLKRAEDNFAANQRLMADTEATLKNMRPEVEALVDISLEPFAQKARAVESTNAQVRANKQKKELRGQFKEKTKQSEALTEKIEALEKGKKRRIAEAKFPVEGLSLSDTKEVEFNGIPFDQVNTAEQLRISMAMGMVMNPKLRVLLIRQGNDLDPDSFKLIGDMAVAGDYQVWLERVSTDGDVSVIIEDGHVKAEQPEQKELV